VTAWRPSDIDATTDETLDRLCRRLGDAKTPYDEISRSRAKARLDAALARDASPRRRRPLGSMVVAFLAGALAAMLVAFVIVPRARPRPAAPAPSRLQFKR
jgi:hypothetical protein